MTPELVAAFGTIIITVFTGFFGLIRYMIKVLSELKPNGGTSLKDQVNRLEQRVDDIYNVLLQIETKGKRKKKNAVEDSKESPAV